MYRSVRSHINVVAHRVGLMAASSAASAIATAVDGLVAARATPTEVHAYLDACEAACAVLPHEPYLPINRQPVEQK